MTDTMSEKRETILRLLQDETGRITDVKIEQQPVPEPEYVFKILRSGSNDTRHNGDIEVRGTGAVASYKTIGNNEVVIPVPFTVNGKRYVPEPDPEGRATFSYTWSSIGKQFREGHPGVYDFSIPFVQEESGKNFSTPYTVTIPPVITLSPGNILFDHTGNGEKIVDIIYKNIDPSPVSIVYDNPEVLSWLNVSLDEDMKHARFSCKDNPSSEMREAHFTFLSSDSRVAPAFLYIQQNGISANA